MPIARRRGLDNRVRYVVTPDHVRPRDAYTDGNDSDDEPYTPTTTKVSMTTRAPSATKAPTWTEREKVLTTSTWNGDDVPVIRVTMVKTFTPTPTITALEAMNPPTETFVTTLVPPPPPPHHKAALSQTTEHLLIAAGSVGATIVLMLFGFAIYVMRKRNLTVADAVNRIKNRRRSRPRGGETRTTMRNWTTSAYAWGRTGPFEHGSNKALPFTPRPVVRRTGSNASRDPFSDEQSLDRQPGMARQASRSRNGAQERSFLLDSPPRPSHTNSHNRNTSETPSSPVLPLQNQRQSASTHNTRSLSDISSDLQYPQPVAMPAPLNIQPAPTFRQFLFNRSYSNPGPKPSPAPPPPPMVSRFSWTNSQAPQTPAPPQTPASAARSSNMPNTAALRRDSVATSRSSVPRFRTIDSWVSQQASHVEEQRLREQIRSQGSAYVETDDEAERVPDVPLLPKSVKTLRESAGLGGGGAAGGNRGSSKQQRRETSTTMTSQTTATVFRQHPGEEVRMSTRSLVPSEILNSKMRASVL